MGTVKSYETLTKGKLYEVWYRKPNGSRGHDRGFRTRKLAETYLTEVEGSKLRGAFIDRADAKATIDELGPDWLERHRAEVTPSTFRAIESAWRTHVQPKWGGYAVGAIRRRDLQVWLNELSQRLGHTSLSRIRDLIAGILDDAIEDNRVLKNAARGITIKRKPLPDEVFLSHKQVESLAAASMYPTLVRFLAYTGLRWGEVTALRVRSVDAARRRVSVREGVTDVNGVHILGSVKSHEKRSVAYPAFLAEEVEAACRGKGPEERLWNGPDGGYLRQGHSYAGWFAGAVKRAMAEDPTFRRVTPHGLRHTAASLAISAGANVKVVQRMLGHKSAKVTLDTYAALFPDDLDNVTAALDRQRADQLVGR